MFRPIQLFAVLAFAAAAAAAQSAFTYQGQLAENGQPVTGTVTLRFQLFDAETGGTPVETIAETPVQVDRGLFTVELDASDPFEEERWLEIAVVGSPADVQVISPRQKIAAAPRSSYSIRTRGIFVDDQLRVGINTQSPAVPLQVRQDASGTDILRLADQADEHELRFRAGQRDTVIEAWRKGSDTPETLLLNPRGGRVDIGPGGLSFPDGTVQRSAAPEIVEVREVTFPFFNIPSESTAIVPLSITGVETGDFAVLDPADPFDSDLLFGPVTTSTDLVTVRIRNFDVFDIDEIDFSFRVMVIRP
jgi:hypothetical protein